MFNITPNIILFSLFYVHLACNIVVRSQSIRFSDNPRKINYANPDEKGYHYCAYYRLADGSSLFGSCDPFAHNRCGKQLDFEYKCCPGYESVQSTDHLFKIKSQDECGQIISPYDTCQSVINSQADISHFSSKIGSVENLNSADTIEPYTLFIPKFRKDSTPVPDHIVKGRFYSRDLRTGMRLPTLNPKRQLYVSKSPVGIISVDCVELSNAELECAKGIIHTITRPLSSGENFDRSSILSLLESNPETRTFANDLPDKLKSKLRDVQSKERYTIIVPSQQAWNDIKQKYSDAKLQSIAANHVLINQYCSGNIIRSSETYFNIQNETLQFMCNIDSGNKEKHSVMSEFSELSDLIETDLASNNGVVHIANKALIPVSARTLKDVLQDGQLAEKLKIKEFVKYIKDCDLQMQDGKRYSIILPQDSAFRWWSTYTQFRVEYDKFQKDSEYRCKVIRYHIMDSNQRLDSLQYMSGHTDAHRTNNQNDILYETTYLKKTSYGSQLNFHYSPIRNLDSYELDDVTFYITHRVNVPPELNITDILQSRTDTTFNYNQTITAAMEEKHFIHNAPKNLYLVTTNDGWRDKRSPPTSVNPYKPELRMYDKNGLENFLKLHHIPLYLWGGDIGYFDVNTVHKFMSSAGVELSFWMDNNGVMRIGHSEMPRQEWPKVIQWNLHARDGIVWLIDGILKCPKQICPLKVEDADYYDVYLAACQTLHLPNEENVKSNFKSKPVDIAAKHPEQCINFLQMSGRFVTKINA